jgi:hypothetical protein
MWQGRAHSQRRCGRGEPSPSADVAGASPLPVQMWHGRAQSHCRCGMGEPSPSADVAGASPVPVQMWQGRAQSRCRCGMGGAQSRCRCGRGEPSPSADVAGASPVGLAYKGHRALGTVSAQLRSPGMVPPRAVRATGRVARCMPRGHCMIAHGCSSRRAAAGAFELVRAQDFPHKAAKPIVRMMRAEVWTRGRRAGEWEVRRAEAKGGEGVGEERREGERRRQDTQEEGRGY